MKRVWIDVDDGISYQDALDILQTTLLGLDVKEFVIGIGVEEKQPGK